MRRWAVAVFVAALVAACGADPTTGAPERTTTESSTAATPPVTPVTTGAPAPSTTTGAGTTEAAATTPPPFVVDGPPAPDFTIPLEDPEGETFVLSEEQKPVYMVFWAEW
jgi:hypothetical protein